MQRLALLEWHSHSAGRPGSPNPSGPSFPMGRELEATTPLANPALNFQRAVHELAAPAYVIDRGGRFCWLNPPFVEMLGDRRGQSFVDGVAPEHRRLARSNLAQKVCGETTTIYDLRVMDRSGQRLTLRITSAPLRRAGAIVGIFGVGVPLDEMAVDADADSLLANLTPRQLDTLRLLGQGLETRQIATHLGIAEETARNHIRALLRAMGARSRLKAVLIGLRTGLLDVQLTQLGQQSLSEAGDG
jgi:DNA-binding CsgD family transcriptional regulator